MRWFVLDCPFSRFVASAVLAGLLCGCAGPGAKSVRLDRYRPRTDNRALEQAVAPTPGAPDETPADTARPAGSHGRLLRPGQAVMINLYGPQPEAVQDVLDDQGQVTLPHLGKVAIGGLTTSEAEIRIEQAYVEAKIYHAINVTVVARLGRYYIRGEVRSQGASDLTAGLTLMQAIAAAGGYTDYAKRTDILLIRGEEVKRFNGNKIDALKQDDPLLEPKDIIIVKRRLIL